MGSSVLKKKSFQTVDCSRLLTSLLTGKRLAARRDDALFLWTGSNLVHERRDRQRMIVALVPNLRRD